MAEETQNPISTSTSPSEASVTTDADSLIAIENLVKTHLAKVDQLKDEARKINEMLQDILINSGVYSEHEEAAKEAIKTKNITKKDLLKDPSAQQLAQKLKSIKSELKEHTSSLSHFVTEFAKQTGANQIEDLNGEIREIITSAKLVKKKV